MKKNENNNEVIEKRLESTGGADTVAAADWQRIRADFAVRAAGDDAVDLAFETHETPYGPMVVGATRQGLVRIALPAESQDAVLENLSKRISPRILRVTLPEITAARSQLDEYFEGGRRRFELPLDWQLTTGFRSQVLHATNEIPYGETRSYRDVAVEAGSPKAVRAAGTALATNPLPIVVPCHRVLRSDGKVGSYLGGSEMKEQLLAMERAPEQASRSHPA